MDTITDIDELLVEINRRLPSEQQIQKDDPLYAGIILNKIALDSYVHLIQKNLEDSLHQLTISSEQQIAKAETVANRLILNGGNNIEKQLDIAAQRWEERLKKAGGEIETTIRQAAWLPGILIAISTCIILGSHLGNSLFTLFHHVK